LAALGTLVRGDERHTAPRTEGPTFWPKFAIFSPDSTALSPKTRFLPATKKIPLGCLFFVFFFKLLNLNKKNKKKAARGKTARAQRPGRGDSGSPTPTGRVHLPLPGRCVVNAQHTARTPRGHPASRGCSFPPRAHRGGWSVLDIPPGDQIPAGRKACKGHWPSPVRGALVVHNVLENFFCTEFQLECAVFQMSRCIFMEGMVTFFSAQGAIFYSGGENILADKKKHKAPKQNTRLHKKNDTWHQNKMHHGAIFFAPINTNPPYYKISKNTPWRQNKMSQGRIFLCTRAQFFMQGCNFFNTRLPIF